jgi:hypothetical protein
MTRTGTKLSSTKYDIKDQISYPCSDCRLIVIVVNAKTWLVQQPSVAVLAEWSKGDIFPTCLEPHESTEHDQI